MHYSRLVSGWIPEIGFGLLPNFGLRPFVYALSLVLGFAHRLKPA